ncbi:Tectonin beta-propeller repeat-containing, partial [Globisporangium splendens]
MQRGPHYSGLEDLSILARGDGCFCSDEETKRPNEAPSAALTRDLRAFKRVAQGDNIHGGLYPSSLSVSVSIQYGERMSLLIRRALTAFVLLLALHQHARVLLVLRGVYWVLVRVLQLAVVLVGSGSFWWVLRTYQLQKEQELHDQAWLKYQFYERYRHRASSGASSGQGSSRRRSVDHGMGGSALKAVKRLPIGAHLRMVWNLPQEICDELALFVHCAVRDYVSYWFQPISPHNDDFPSDVKFLLADLLGAVSSRVLEIDSSQALTMTAKSLELLRMHLGWFREAYAQLEDEFPEAFEPDDDDRNLQKRQEYVAAFAQKSPFLHPGCVAAASTNSGTNSSSPSSPRPNTTSPLPGAGRKPSGQDSPEAMYLRHVACQLLGQLKPQLAQQYDSNVFVSLVMNLLREATAFKILKPLAEYAHPRYANELVLSCLQALLVDKDGLGPLSPTGASTFGGGHLSGGSVSLMPSMTLNKLRLTKSFLYKATKRSTEQAEAAFQAVVDAVSSAASAAAGVQTDDSGSFDDWNDDGYALDGEPSAPQGATAAGNHDNRRSHHGKQPFASLFSLDDRLSLAKQTTSRLTKTSRNFMPGSSFNGPRSSSTGHMDDLKNMKANLNSSFNSSIGKVKRRFRTLSGHPNDPDTPNSGTNGNGFSSTQAAARMMKKPGMLLQKALQRRPQDHNPMMSPTSPTSSLDDILTPPPLTDDDFFLGGEDDSSDPPSPTQRALETDDAIEGDDAARERDDDDCDEDNDDIEEENGGDEDEEDEVAPALILQERVVERLEKAIATYVRMYHERPEMRNSSRSRELFELVSAMEDLFMLGYVGRFDERNPHEINEVGGATPPFASPVTINSHDQQFYWEYLAQDRIEAPLLNAHWRFVANKCPACVSENESLYSTRGVQWLLVALEKGMLYDYMTALHVKDKRVTQRFYDYDGAVLCNTKLMASVLQSLSQLHKLTLALEIPLLLGRKSDMDEAFGVAATQPTRRLSRTRSNSGNSSRSTPVCVMESVWEVERYVPIHGWTKAQDKRWQELPSSEWVWEGDWTLETPITESSDGGWTYAKTFEDRFHDKEKKFDSVRRRKWIRRRRQLPPLLSSLVAFSASPSSPSSRPRVPSVSPSSPPTLFGVASLPVPSPSVVSIGATATGKGVRNLKHLFDSSKRAMKAKAEDFSNITSASPVTKKFVKRRSFSFDKSNLASPITNAEFMAPSATTPLSPVHSPLASGDKGVSFSPSSKKPASGASSPTAGGKKKMKRGSIPLLRRANTSSDKDGMKSAVALMRSTTTGSESRKHSVTSSAGTRTSFGGEWDDDDDDENMCFRCLSPFPELASGSPSNGNSTNITSSSSGRTCPSCQQRVCPSCHSFFAFLVFPPPLETTKKAQVCGTCYDRLVAKYKLQIDAHVSKYFIRERDNNSNSSDALTMAALVSPSGNGMGNTTNDTESSSSNGTKTPPSKFEITVFVNNDASCAWSVVKSFQDFEALEKSLCEKMKQQEKKHGIGSNANHWKGVDYLELMAVAPRLKDLPVAALSYDKRLYVLEEFLQSVLACDTLCQSPAVQKFLALSNAAVATRSGSDASRFPASPKAAADSIGNEHLRSPRGGMSMLSGIVSTPLASINGAGALLMENGKWRKGRWVAPETNTKETKMRILQKLEVSLFAVVGELFEFDGIGMVRRQLFAMSRSFIKAFLSASHFRKFEKQYLSFTDPKRLASMIVDFREYMFPDANAPPVPSPPATLSTLELQTLRKDVLEAILASFPSTAVSLFGETSCENAALKLHEFLQHEVFVKNLLFSIADDVLLHVFPDFVSYTKPPQRPASTPQ